MKKFFLIIFSFFLFSGFVLAQKNLEIEYPQIGGYTPSPTDLPGYINYIYKFSVWIIGLIIFGVIVYNGFLYLISAGNVSKMMEAKEGIISGFLGAFILLMAVILFNTINPQLTILNLQKLTPISYKLTPGFYVCKKSNEYDISGLLSQYYFPPGANEDEKEEKRKEAGLKLNSYLFSKNCEMLKGAGKFWYFKIDKDNYIFFVVPKEVFVEGKRQYEINYGAVIFEKDNHSGKCAFVPKFRSGGKLGKKVAELNINNDLFLTPTFMGNWKGRSYVVYQFPTSETSTIEEVSFYTCTHFNEEGLRSCPGDPDSPMIYEETPYLDEDEDIYLEKFFAGGTTTLFENINSIKIYHPGKIDVLLLDHKDGNDSCDLEAEEGDICECEVIWESVSDLSSHRMGKCGEVLGGVIRKGRSCVDAVLLIRKL